MAAVFFGAEPEWNLTPHPHWTHPRKSDLYRAYSAVKNGGLPPEPFLDLLVETIPETAPWVERCLTLIGGYELQKESK